MADGASSDGMRAVAVQVRNTSDTTINPATEETLGQIVQSVDNAIDSTSFDLNAGAFSSTTNITNDYILDNIELNFSTPETKTITVTSHDGTILFGGSVDTGVDNLGRNSTAKNVVLGFGRAFNTGENITVAVTQTSGACSLDVILKVIQGNNAIGGNPVLGAGSNVVGITQDFFFEIVKGNVPGHSAMHKFGENDTIGSTVFETLWEGSNPYPYLTSAVTLKVSSDDVDDNSTGDGGRTVELFGLDTNYDEITEIISLNGQTEVITTKSYLRIYRMIIRSAGSTGGLEGTCYAGTGTVTAGVPAVILAQAKAMHNQTLMALYTIPNGKTGYIIKKFAGTNKDKQVNIHLMVRPFGEVFQIKQHDTIFQDRFSHTFELPIVALQKADIELRAKVSTSTAEVSGGFDIVLVDN